MNKVESLTKLTSSYAGEIIGKIEPYLNFKTYQHGQRFLVSASQQRLFVIRKGITTLNRQSDDLLLGFYLAPSIRGVLIPYATDISEYLLKVIDSAEIAIVEYELFTSLLSDFALWETYLKHLQLALSVSLEQVLKLTLPNAYDVIRLQLIELMSEPDIVRKSVTAEQYIRSKTRISRSRIMNILRRLRSLGHINTERGVLIEIGFIPETDEIFSPGHHGVPLVSP